MTRPWGCFAVFLLLAIPCAPAAAQQPASDKAGDVAEAEVLYREGDGLKNQGRCADAIPKFEESNRIAPSNGTTRVLAECNEQIGRTATAYSLWMRLAEDYHRNSKDTDAQRMFEQAERLFPDLSMLTIRVDPDTARPPGLMITRDGSVVSPGKWGSKLPVDPGEHTVTASAPGKQPWTQKVQAEKKQAAEVIIPNLADAPTPPQRVGAFVAGGVGLAGILLGSISGVIAVSKWNEAKDVCMTKPGTTSVCTNGEKFGDAKDLEAGARTAAAISTVGFVVGGLGLATGTVLWFTAPKSGGTPSVQTGFQVTPKLAYGTLNVTF